MFTEQIATMGAHFREAGMPDGVVAAFEQLMGSCAAVLSHRGTVNLPGLSLIQVPPSGQAADEVLPPKFTVPPVGHVQLLQVTSVPTKDADGNWILIGDPVGDLDGNPDPDPVNGAPVGAMTVYLKPSSDGEPQINVGDIVQWNYIPENSYGGGQTPKAFDYLCENRWMSALRTAGVTIEVGDGPPVDGVTGAGAAGKGSLYIDSTTPDLWQNIGDSDSPVWAMNYYTYTT